MPVAVIGAAGAVGRVLVPRLAARGGEVRASAPDRSRAEVLRALGAKVAVGDAADPDVLWPLLQDVHTMCHVGAEPLATDPDTELANLEAIRTAVVVAGKANVRRVLFLSYVGASVSSDNPTLRALGHAEDLVRGSAPQHVILRATHVAGEGSPWLASMAPLARRRPPVVVGPGTQELAPVLVQDVADVLAAADDRAEAVSGVLAVQGPDRMTADGWADVMAGRTRRWRRHVDRVPGLGDAAVRILAMDSLADAPDGYARFGVVPSSVRPALQGPGGGGG